MFINCNIERYFKVISVIRTDSKYCITCFRNIPVNTDGIRSEKSFSCICVKTNLERDVRIWEKRERFLVHFRELFLVHFNVFLLIQVN